jgi:hypothetical protein
MKIEERGDNKNLRSVLARARRKSHSVRLGLG